ncbi:MAG: transglutaminase family protein [Lapillicoccus sp.]
MRRTVTAHLELQLGGWTTTHFSVASAAAADPESLVVTLDGRPMLPSLVLDEHGTRLHRVDADEGTLVLDYAATVTGRAEPLPAGPLDLLTFVRPSRYCESDILAPTAHAEFARLEGHTLLSAVSSFVHDRITYVPGSSGPTDGAVETLLTRKGVCRDFAHLSIALLRACDVPARMASVYAPGLFPMDFHAVCEAWVDGQWCVVDATWLAPRQSLLRIATGRDAADTAFATTSGPEAVLSWLEVSVVVDVLPFDDWRGVVQLG